MRKGYFEYKFTRKRHDIPVLFIKREVLVREIAAMFPLGQIWHLVFLSMTKKRIADDWFYNYKYSPVLVETFVETPRFYGTCYKAANWICLGQTKGIGRLGVSDNPQLPIKSIWVYPLAKSFRKHLCK